MKIDSVSLTNFRSYARKEFRFENSMVIISGSNGVGKTNIMEAINLLSIGKSFRAELEEEMISYTQEIGRVKAKVVSGGPLEIEVVLTRGEVAGEKVGRKKFLVNGVGKRMVDSVGILKSVLFGPWDLDLITGSPSLRRRYLDSVLIQVDKEYGRALISYEKGLRQRNKLLERIREEGSHRSQLLFWDMLLIKNGEYISGKREELLNFLSANQPLIDSGVNFYTVYDRSVISESRLEQYAEEEVAAGVTLVGPHRDDASFFWGEKEKGRDLSKFGSRGEQRLAVLWLKLGELEYMANQGGERPVLLLDDIFSELDHEHRKLVGSVVGRQQTFITTADQHQVAGLADSAQVITLN